jgi:hypothetical protein
MFLPGTTIPCLHLGSSLLRGPCPAVCQLPRMQLARFQGTCLVPELQLIGCKPAACAA